AVAAVDGLQRDGELGAGVATWLGTAGRARATAPAPEQLLEEVAEAATGAAAGEDLVIVEATGGALAESTLRRPHFVARAVAALAQLVIGGALLRVAQRLVGLVDGLEFFLCPGFLADVGVVLAGEPPVGSLDLRFAGAGFDAEDPVVVLELHASGAWCWEGKD